jgi:hypothetical protein
VQNALEAMRENPGVSPSGLSDAIEALPRRLAEDLRREAGGLRRVLNATGVFLHTNLGRAPLDPGVARTLPPLLDAACDLEYDLESGRRGRRQKSIEPLLRAACGAESSLVVNNNAAALLLACAGLAAGKEIVVARGELVEIGGSFRIPDILATAGASRTTPRRSRRPRRCSSRCCRAITASPVSSPRSSRHRSPSWRTATACRVWSTRAAGCSLLTLRHSCASTPR